MKLLVLVEGFATVNWYSLYVAVLRTLCAHIRSCTAYTTATNLVWQSLTEIYLFHGTVLVK